MTNITVVKRDGTLEKYSKRKISKVVMAAGLDETRSEELAFLVTKELEKTGLPQVTSLQVRDLVVQFLHDMDQAVANFFTWYQKTKDGTSPPASV